MEIVLYGIPNCDTVKKARAWMQQHGLVHAFHDFKKVGVTRELVESWLAQVEWDALVNRKGATWRGLSDARKLAITGTASATELMLESPSVIKRPVLVCKGGTHVGFSDALYQQIFKK